jgi:hypothetical protein
MNRATIRRLMVLICGVFIISSVGTMPSGGRAQAPSGALDTGIVFDAETGELEPLRQPRQVRLDPGEQLSIVCQGMLGLTPVPPSSATAVCSAVLPPATATPVPSTATRTSTAIPSPTMMLATATSLPGTVTPVPTTRPEATPTPMPPGSMIEGVPVCTHDDRTWHGLVERNADNTIRCTYGSTHFDDPRPLDGALGPWPFAQTISYPHETVDENHRKHNVYKWATYDNPTCQSRVPGLTLRAARMQYHGDAHAGALTRFHSYYTQARWCDTTNPSYDARVSIGGHLDSCILSLKNATGGETYLPLPNDPPLDDPCRASRQRIHGQPAFPRLDFTWYWGNGGAPNPLNGIGLRLGFSSGIRNEDWGPVDPASPNSPELLFYGGVQNHSYQDPLHIYSMFIGDAVNHQGYTDRHGWIVTGCTTPGLDCVPFSVSGMRAGVEHQFRSDVHALLCCREYDVMSPVTGKSLIVYPN